MTNLGRAMSYNIFGQALARVFSFGINIFLLRVVEGAVLGLVNVRLTLLYNTILFLTREPFRKGNILSLSWPKLINVIWLSPFVCFLVSLLCVSIWSFFTSGDVPLLVVSAFALSAIIESLAEPFAIISLRFSLAGYFAAAQSVLVMLPKIVVSFLILSKFWAFGQLEMFAFAQVLASSIYLLINVICFYLMSQRKIEELPAASGFRSFFPTPSAGLDSDSMKSVFTLFTHSILKQLLTDGSAFVMTFANVISLEKQAVFDAVEKLGSLVARIVLAPLEETCFADFSRKISGGSEVFKKNSDSHDGLVLTFSTVLHGVSVIGLSICTFGVPYSKLAVWLYGGSRLADNDGAMLLSLYAVYIYVMAINGITECLAMASMDNQGVRSHGRFLFLNAVVHILLNLGLCWLLPPGYTSAAFILANVITMLVRIVYSWRTISDFLADRCPSVTTIFPHPTTAFLLFMGFFMTMLSFLLFGREPGLTNSVMHVSLGAVMFVMISFSTYKSDHLMQSFFGWFYKSHSD